VSLQLLAAHTSVGDELKLGRLIFSKHPKSGEARHQRWQQRACGSPVAFRLPPLRRIFRRSVPVPHSVCSMEAERVRSELRCNATGANKQKRQTNKQPMHRF
jgi:hypothetical protein